MPLFHFHLRTPDGLEEDGLGIELPDLEHAYLEAYRAIPETAADLLREGAGPLSHAFVIADPAGTVLMEVPFTEPVRARAKPPRERAGRSRRLSEEIAAAIARARETVRQSRELLARAQDRGW